MMPVLPELILKARDWSLLRIVTRHSEIRNWIENLSEKGRLTAGLNWYGSNFRQLLFPNCSKVNVPVLGIWGTQDRFVGSSQMKKSSKYAISHFEYHEVDGASHWVQLDKPELLSGLIMNFYLRNR
jgi:pimeloyl-ACP methyl ester carboxylesterase